MTRRLEVAAALFAGWLVLGPSGCGLNPRPEDPTLGSAAGSPHGNDAGALVSGMGGSGNRSSDAGAKSGGGRGGASNGGTSNGGGNANGTGGAGFGGSLGSGGATGGSGGTSGAGGATGTGGTSGSGGAAGAPGADAGAFDAGVTTDAATDAGQVTHGDAGDGG